MKKLFSPQHLAVRLLILLLLAGAIFTLLYYKDNKYTYGGTQPIAGTLLLTEQQLREQPLRFLVREWAFYPDQLLSPSDFDGKTPQGYMRYVSIGQYGGMEMGVPSHSPHGSGTYVLTLFLPETPRTYAIELPEIFSAYRFYVDGDLLVQVGNPDPDHFEAAMQNKMATFYKGGRIQLTIAVTDLSGIYGGMTSPPAFGKPEAIGTMRELRGFSSAFTIVFAGGAFLAALYFAVYLRQRDAGLFAVLCILLMGYAAANFLYTYTSVPRLPWYSLRLMILYGAYPVVLLLHHRICGTDGHLKKIPQIAVYVFIACAFLYSLLGAQLHFCAMRRFSDCILAFKWAFAAYLLVTTVISARKSITFSEPQFLASTFFAASLIADRLMPLYEPILGSWFPTIGGLVVIGAIGWTLWKEVAEAYRFHHLFEMECRQMERQLSMQKEHLLQLSEQMEQMRRLNHDYRHHLRILRSYAHSQNTSELIRYIDSLDDAGPELDGQSLCEHPAADALLQYYTARGKQTQIAFDIRLELLPGLAFPDSDLCVLLGNLLENAMEACMRQKNGLRFIRVRGNANSGQLLLMIENSYTGKVRMQRKSFLSEKHEGIGIGTESVREVVKRNGGFVSFRPRELVFQVSVLVPLREKAHG